MIPNATSGADALNRDLPIDEFIRLQISGDLTGDPEKSVATGVLALGPVYQPDGGDPDSIAQAHTESLDDRIDTFARGLLGITVSCARCHDHKSDPIPKEDYYSLAGVFNNTGTRELPIPDERFSERFAPLRFLFDLPRIDAGRACGCRVLGGNDEFCGVLLCFPNSSLRDATSASSLRT